MGSGAMSPVATIFLVGSWYISTAMFSVFGKRLLKGAGNLAYSDPDDSTAWQKLQIVTAVSLTWLQSGVAFLVYAIARASGVVDYLRPEKEGEKANLTKPEMLGILRTPGILYFLGNLFGNLAMVMATVSTTQTYKAAEPLFVVVCLRFLNYEKFEKQVTKAVVLWLFFIVFGVAVGTYNPPMSLTAMFAAGCSNIVFAISAVQIKTIQDDTSLPMLDIFGACVAVGTLAGAAVTAITVLTFGGQIGLIGVGNASKQDGFMSGAAYGLYNCFSFLVLGAVTNTTHAVLKVGKRICTLVIAGLILHDHLGYRRWFGVWMAISAIVMFEDAKKAKTSGTSPDNGTRPVPWKLLSAAASFVLLAVLLTGGIAPAAASNYGDLTKAPSTELSFPGLCEILPQNEEDLAVNGQTFMGKPWGCSTLAEVPGCTQTGEKRIRNLQEGAEIKKILAVYNLLPLHWGCGEYSQSDNQRAAFDDGSHRNGMTSNYGNQVWATAALWTIDQTKWRFVSIDSVLENPNQTKVDAVLVPTANVLRDKSDISTVDLSRKFVRSISPIKKPSLLVGIGFQAYFEGVVTSNSAETEEQIQRDLSGVNLHPDHVKMLQTFENSFLHSNWMARGRHTVSLAAKGGAPRGLPVGCPSFFLDHNPFLGRNIEAQFKQLATFTVAGMKNLKVGILMPASGGPEKVSEFHTMLTFLNGILDATHPSSFVAVQTAGDISHTSLHNRHRARFFPEKSLQEWRGALSEMDIVIGSRIHGSMMGLYAGKPTITFANDYRILEMVQAMGLPHVTPADPAIAKWAKPQQVASESVRAALLDLIRRKSAAYSGEAFDELRSKTARTYKSVYARWGVDLAPGILDIADKRHD